MAWDETLDKSGSRALIPSLPSTSLTLDQNIESNGLDGQTLSGNITSTRHKLKLDLDRGIMTAGDPTGQRVVVDGKNNRLSFYDQSGTMIGNLFGDYEEGHGIMVSGNMEFEDGFTSNSECAIRGPLSVGILGTDGVVSLKGNNANGAKVTTIGGDLNLDADTGFNITTNKPLRAFGGYLSSLGNPGITAMIEYQDWGGEFHTLFFEDGLLTASI